jgi:hypothetical protein
LPAGTPQTSIFVPSETSETSTNDETPSELTDSVDGDGSRIEVKIYYTEDAAQSFKYHTMFVSSEDVLNDSIAIMKDVNNIEIDRIWYEGITLCVDLNENERRKLDYGSAAGNSIVGCIVRTFINYPDVVNIEILLGGKKEEFGNHFSLNTYFFSEDGRIITKLGDGTESEFQSWAHDNYDSFFYFHSDIAVSNIGKAWFGAWTASG